MLRRPFALGAAGGVCRRAIFGCGLLLGIGPADLPAAAPNGPTAPNGPVPPVQVRRPPAPRASEPWSSAAARVDALLAEELPTDGSTGHGSKGAGGPADDATFVRRAYYDVVGESPTAAQLTAFVLDPSTDKRGALVQKLLADPRFGLNWGRYWRDVILYRRAEDRALLTSAAATRYFAERLNAGAPWSTIARDLITATGDVAERGETVLLMSQMGDPNEVAAEVSRIFCGVQLSCAECHDHPTDRWKRGQFHELAAFFPRVAVRPVMVDGRQRGFEVVGRDVGPRGGFAAANNPRFRPIEHYMPDLKDPSARGALMTPVFFVTGQKLAEGVSDADRRAAIADWITSPENPWFARALVNRIWAELVGRGFYEPVDDLGPDRTAIAPQTLAYLSEKFTADGYDLKELYRTIMATESYGRSRRQAAPGAPADGTATAATVAQEKPAERLRRLRGDQLYDALLNALGMPHDAEPATGGYGRAALGSPRARFNQVFGHDPGTPPDEVTGSIPQALVLMNGSNLAAGVSGADRRTMLGKLLAQEADDETAAVELYLRALAREPNDKELAVCLDHVKQTGNRVEAFEDILWSIVNSTEFLHRQ